MTALVPHTPTNAEVYRASTDAAGLCRDIVLKTAQQIGGRKYVRVEGWQAIAIAHGCTASADDVERVNDEGMGGFRAVGIVRRMSDGAEIARAEGFIGDDEAVWAKRPVYARRAMVQTRAISRACRSAFAHVVVLIDSDLSTTPAEEVPEGGFDDAPRSAPRNVTPAKEDGQAVRARFQAEALRLIGSLADVKDEPGIKAWWPDNQRDLDMLPDDLFLQVKDRYQDRWDEIAKTKPAGRSTARLDFDPAALEGEMA